MAKTNYLEDKILNHVLRNTAYTSPTTVYAALFTSAPGEAGGGTEVVGGGYNRQSISFASPSSGSISNNAVITFSGVPALTITYVGIFDASTSGNLLYFDALPSTIATIDGSDVEFDVGEFTVTED